MSGQKLSLEKLKQAILADTVEILPGDEKQLEGEIQTLIENAEKSGQPIRHYIGFEISGQLHLGTGMMTALKIKKLQEAGVKCSIYMANYHTWLNKKLDGQMDTILTVKKNYFQPAFQKCLEVAGCRVDEIDFLGGEELYQIEKNFNGKKLKYLDFMMKVALNLTLKRVNKSITITGKKEGDAVPFGLMCYPPMQVADAFFMQTHLVHAGLDQRKCHVLMREVAGQLDEGFELKIGSEKIKPIAIHHPLLLSLTVDPKTGTGRMNANDESLKMSKSKAGSAVWVHDGLEEISKKLKKAYCPQPREEQTLEEAQAEQQFNPILDWWKKLLFPMNFILELKRPGKYGGDKTYTNFESLQADYFDRKIHPMDLKNGTAETLAKWLKPIYDWKEELLKTEAGDVFRKLEKGF